MIISEENETKVVMFYIIIHLPFTKYNVVNVYKIIVHLKTVCI